MVINSISQRLYIKLISWRGRGGIEGLVTSFFYLENFAPMMARKNRRLMNKNYFIRFKDRVFIQCRGFPKCFLFFHFNYHFKDHAAWVNVLSRMRKHTSALQFTHTTCLRLETSVASSEIRLFPVGYTVIFNI